MKENAMSLANNASLKKRRMKIYAPAGNLASIKCAIDAGADAVYAGFRSPSNLRNFAGINLSEGDMAEGVEYAHKNGRELFITVNSYPQQKELAACLAAVDSAHSMKADAIIATDLSVLDYAVRNYPELKLHLSVQAGASNIEAVNFFKENFNISTVILPRVVTLDEIAQIAQNTDVETEVFAFGSLCINYEGKCLLSPYITGESTNTIGTCSTPGYMSFHRNGGRLSFMMNGIVMNEYGEEELGSKPRINADGYKEDGRAAQWTDNFMINRRQICKGRFINSVTGKRSYPFQSPVYLNAAAIIGKIAEAGVGAIKIEGRQRSEGYVARSVTVFREVVDNLCKNGDRELPAGSIEALNGLFEGIAPSYSCYLCK